MWGLDSAAISWIKGWFYTPASGKGFGGLDADACPGWVLAAPCLLLEGSPRVSASPSSPKGSMDELSWSSRNKGSWILASRLSSSTSWYAPRMDAFTVTFCLCQEEPLERSREQLWELVVLPVQVSFLFSFALLPSWRAELRTVFPH